MAVQKFRTSDNLCAAQRGMSAVYRKPGAPDTTKKKPVATVS